LDRDDHATRLRPTNGTSLYYEICGDGDPFVLLHGFSFNHRMWDDQLDALAERYRVVRMICEASTLA
jgi:pimeloyl-ACP methyl ester carboxylesterase